MNLADAIRQAAQQTGLPLPSEAPKADVVDATQQFTKAAAFDVVPERPEVPSEYEMTSSNPVQTPVMPVVSSGGAVRLELFLSPDQMASLFKAVVATQHSVMTLREAATYLRITSSVLEQMAQEGDVPAFMIDGRWRFPRNGVDEWLTAQAQDKVRKELEA